MTSDDPLSRHARRGQTRQCRERPLTRLGLLSLRLRGGWLAFLLVLVVGLTWQSFLTETHQHVASAVAKAQGVDADPADRKTSSDQPASCPICRAIAHTGYYLSPTLATVTPPLPPAFDFAVAVPLSAILSRRSHAWRSRAPPTPLQA